MLFQQCDLICADQPKIEPAIDGSQLPSALVMDALAISIKTSEVCLTIRKFERCMVDRECVSVGELHWFEGVHRRPQN